MSLDRTRKQEIDGEQAVFESGKKGTYSRLYALDFTGREIPLYVEKQSRDPQTGQLPAEEPRFFCPSCGDNFLNDKGISGPNSEKAYTCPGCNISWNRSQQMLKGIGLVMQ
jgi:hypothetical protein